MSISPDVGQGTGLCQPCRAAAIVLAGLLAGAVLATWVSEVALGGMGPGRPSRPATF